MRKTDKRKSTPAEIAEQKARIMAYLADDQAHTFTDIQEACGLTEMQLYNRLSVMRHDRQVDYDGRRRSGAGNLHHSFYKRAAQPGEIPAHVAGMPETWLRWGGWAA